MDSNIKYIQYDHVYQSEKGSLSAKVWVREDLKGEHREHCLCWKCEKLTPEDRTKNCPIATKVFTLCVEENLVLPVWECPVFVEKGLNYEEDR